MLEDRKILVTGATGQIAGPIAENFAKDNAVWCAARFSDPKRKAELEEMGIKTCVWDMDSGDASMLPMHPCGAFGLTRMSRLRRVDHQQRRGIGPADAAL